MNINNATSGPPKLKIIRAVDSIGSSIKRD